MSIISHLSYQTKPCVISTKLSGDWEEESGIISTNPSILTPSSRLTSLIFGQLSLLILLLYNHLPIFNSSACWTRLTIISQYYGSLDSGWKRSRSKGAEIDLCLLVGGPSVRSRLCEACDEQRFMMVVIGWKIGWWERGKLKLHLRY